MQDRQQQMPLGSCGVTAERDMVVRPPAGATFPERCRIAQHPIDGRDLLGGRKAAGGSYVH
jgi:hypothetical protein